MISVVLMICRILAGILLTAAGLVLLAVFLVLMIPIRYQLDGSYETKPWGIAELSWMFHLLRLTAEYQDGLMVQLRLFGIQFFSTEEDPEEVGNDSETEAGTEPEMEAGEEPESESKTEAGTEPESEPEMEAGAEPESEPEMEAGAEPESEPKTEAGAEPESEPEMEAGAEPESKAGTEYETEAALRQESGLEVLKRRVSDVWNRMRRKVRSLYARCHTRKQKISDFVGDLCGKKEQVLDFVRNEENQKTFRLIKAQLIRLWRHIRPQKISGYVRFGFDDPYYTGMVLTYVSPFYGMYAESLDLIPVFEEQVLEAELKIKGRIRIGTLLWCALRVCLNKNFRRLYRKFRNHK